LPPPSAPCDEELAWSHNGQPLGIFAAPSRIAPVGGERLAAPLAHVVRY
jgi:hypothetical protein